MAGAPTPAGDLGCLRAAREPLSLWLPGNQRTVPRVSVWGSLGEPQAIPGGCTSSSPSPSPTPSPTPILAGECPSAHTDICAQAVHVSCSVILLVDICLGVGLLNHMVLLVLVPSGTSILFSIVALPTHIPTNRGGEFPFSTSSPAFVIYRLFHEDHSD